MAMAQNMGEPGSAGYQLHDGKTGTLLSKVPFVSWQHAARAAQHKARATGRTVIVADLAMDETVFMVTAEGRRGFLCGGQLIPVRTGGRKRSG